VKTIITPEEFFERLELLNLTKACILMERKNDYFEITFINLTENIILDTFIYDGFCNE